MDADSVMYRLWRVAVDTDMMCRVAVDTDMMCRVAVDTQT